MLYVLRPWGSLLSWCCSLLIEGFCFGLSCTADIIMVLPKHVKPPSTGRKAGNPYHSLNVGFTTWTCLNPALNGNSRLVSLDRLVVRTLRYCRSNPGSNPNHGSSSSVFLWYFFNTIRPRSSVLCFSFFLYSSPFIEFLFLFLLFWTLNLVFQQIG